mgnify:FL=1
MTDVLKVWGIIEGPIHCEDLPERDDLAEECKFLLVCKAEDNGKVFDQNFWFESLAGAYEWKKYFDKNIEPLEIEGYEKGDYSV